MTIDRWLDKWGSQNQLKMTQTPSAKLTWTFQTTHFLGPFIYLLKLPPHCSLIHTFYLFLCLQLSDKTSTTLVHPCVGNCVVRTSIHFQHSWLLCTDLFHIHPWALACLSPLSICLDSNVPACGWLDSWNGTESPNNARGLHGQAALHSQRHLSCGEGLLSESQGDTYSLYTWLYL